MGRKMQAQEAQVRKFFAKQLLRPIKVAPMARAMPAISEIRR